MVKTSEKFQKNWNKTVGVAHIRYPLSIHFHCQNARKMTKFKLQNQSRSKNNLKIIYKPHAHLQSMVKTSVTFQKNRNKTVVLKSCAHKVHTSIGGRKDKRTVSRKLCPSAFLRKGGGQLYLQPGINESNTTTHRLHCKSNLHRHTLSTAVKHYVSRLRLDMDVDVLDHGVSRKLSAMYTNETVELRMFVTT